MMVWRDIIEMYGEEMAERIMKNKYMQGITIGMVRLSDGKPANWDDWKNGDAEPAYFERDLDLAYRDIAGISINPMEWD